MTRKDYQREYHAAFVREGSAAATEVHQRFYAQFATEAVITCVVGSIGADELLRSRDPHFNDIQLIRWDRLPESVIDRGRYREVSGSIGFSLSDQVCIFKAAARVWRDREDKRTAALWRQDARP